MNAHSFARKALQFVGWGRSEDGSDKEIRKGKFSPSADKVRADFFEFKKAHPEVKSVEEMDALQRRMQSGSV